MDSLKDNAVGARSWDKINYYADFIVLPVILIIIFFNVAKYHQLSWYMVGVFGAGFLFYGAVLEYMMHRWVYHGPIKQIKKLHLLHHKFPQSYLSSPPYLTVLFALLLYLGFASLFGSEFGCLFVGGIVLGYLWYITIHHLIHHIPGEDSRVLNYFKMAHEHHHRHGRTNYCVSQPFWNDIYQACYQSTKIFYK